MPEILQIKQLHVLHTQTGSKTRYLPTRSVQNTRDQAPWSLAYLYHHNSLILPDKTSLIRVRRTNLQSWWKCSGNESHSSAAGASAETNGITREHWPLQSKKSHQKDLATHPSKNLIEILIGNVHDDVENVELLDGQQSAPIILIVNLLDEHLMPAVRLGLQKALQLH